jgi:hypothetical protein
MTSIRTTLPCFMRICLISGKRLLASSYLTVWSKVLGRLRMDGFSLNLYRRLVQQSVEKIKIWLKSTISVILSEKPKDVLYYFLQNWKEWSIRIRNFLHERVTRERRPLALSGVRYINVDPNGRIFVKFDTGYFHGHKEILNLVKIKQKYRILYMVTYTCSLQTHDCASTATLATFLTSLTETHRS